jgi:hypothetical protein
LGPLVLCIIIPKYSIISKGYWLSLKKEYKTMTDNDKKIYIFSIYLLFIIILGGIIGMHIYPWWQITVTIMSMMIGIIAWWGIFLSIIKSPESQTIRTWVYFIVASLIFYYYTPDRNTIGGWYIFFEWGIPLMIVISIYYYKWYYKNFINYLLLEKVGLSTFLIINILLS